MFEPRFITDNDYSLLRELQKACDLPQLMQFLTQNMQMLRQSPRPEQLRAMEELQNVFQQLQAAVKHNYDPRFPPVSMPSRDSLARPLNVILYRGILVDVEYEWETWNGENGSHIFRDYYMNGCTEHFDGKLGVHVWPALDHKIALREFRPDEIP
ncbi:hypothetical protein BDV96DRAFT_655360 [Lophiotrema nucula]|uniref:Uncharacterized protein n=1 Tax=Lophiotrema nucula TaxID=690887 RepID=A0A6A5YHS0_9PLEO|nr:hypothetical protein BDV96DRAFT_655360 [Lophiotrema nucula]